MISINIVFNESGIVNQAEKAKEYQANAEAYDMELVDKLNNELKEYMNGNNGYVDSELITSPKLSDGMIPVKWNGTNWVKTTANDSLYFKIK